MELERNYHIFYQLCSGEFPEINKEIMLEADASKYFYINQGMLKIDKVDDNAEMRDTKKAFDILMFTHQQQMDLFKITSAIANWGNTQWKQRPREEQAEPESTEDLEIAAKLYGVDTDALVKGLTKPRIKVY
jgi:myosin heavy subunit